ncbi:cytochrome P450 [Russula compacta]|nr:cytochrome P450 [Russula compacta]
MNLPTCSDRPNASGCACGRRSPKQSRVTRVTVRRGVYDGGGQDSYGLPQLWVKTASTVPLFSKVWQLNGTALPSLALEDFQEVENQKLSGSGRIKAEEAIAGALGSIYIAGVDTTASVTKSFIVAMLLYPDIQKKAQDELDSVVGKFSDGVLSPLLVCFLNGSPCEASEQDRMYNVSLAGVPHAATKDDVYAGFFTPKGAMVVVNTWAILHNPTFYPEPDIFKPERFLSPNGSLRDDPILTSAFGFGKRICPGRHLVDATLLISVASLFSTFSIERARDCGDKLSDYTSTYTGTRAVHRARGLRVYGSRIVPVPFADCSSAYTVRVRYGCRPSKPVRRRWFTGVGRALAQHHPAPVPRIAGTAPAASTPLV